MAGQPVKYKPDELSLKFDEYLKETKDFPSILSFCLYCDMNRQTFYNYKEMEGYLDTIEKIEVQLEQITINQIITARNPAGAIFYAKNKFGYADKMEVKSETTDKSAFERMSKEELEAELEKMGYRKKE